MLDRTLTPLLTAAALLLAAGCGRFGYDAQSPTGGDGGAADAAVLDDDADQPDADPAAIDADLADADLADAAPAAIDAGPCPPECNAGCALGACHIQGDNLSGTITCPTGMPCDISCDGFQGCKADIDCAGASSCEIDCIGTSSCFFAITCGAAPCAVHCTAADTCATINCGDAAACAVTCSGPGSCTFPVHCGVNPCAVDCSGAGSCQGSVDCDTSCACDVTCALVADCPDPPAFVSCPTGCEVSDGCSSAIAGCDTCP